MDPEGLGPEFHSCLDCRWVLDFLMSLQVTFLFVCFVAELATKTQDLNKLVPTKVDDSVYLVDSVFSLWVVGPIIRHSTFDGVINGK